jgi:hypothetical protein
LFDRSRAIEARMWYEKARSLVHEIGYERRRQAIEDFGRNLLSSLTGRSVSKL